MTNLDFSKFELVLLPGKCLPDGPHSGLYEDVYKIWKDTWIKVFTEVGSPQAWNADGFFRCDMIPVILYDGDIAAFFAASTYSLQPSVIADHSYFSIFPKHAVEKMRSEGVRNVMSYEFLTVLPAWRKAELGLSLGAVLVELGLSIRDELGCDGGVGVARIQNKIDQIARAVGALTLEKEARRGNLVCEIVGFVKKYDRPYPQENVHNLAVQLWNGRRYIDRFGHEIRKNSKLEQAA